MLDSILDMAVSMSRATSASARVTVSSVRRAPSAMRSPMSPMPMSPPKVVRMLSRKLSVNRERLSCRRPSAALALSLCRLSAAIMPTIISSAAPICCLPRAVAMSADDLACSIWTPSWAVAPSLMRSSIPLSTPAFKSSVAPASNTMAVSDNRILVSCALSSATHARARATCCTSRLRSRRPC